MTISRPLKLIEKGKKLIPGPRTRWKSFHAWWPSIIILFTFPGERQFVRYFHRPTNDWNYFVLNFFTKTKFQYSIQLTSSDWWITLHKYDCYTLRRSDIAWLHFVTLKTVEQRLRQMVGTSAPNVTADICLFIFLS